MKKKLTIVAKNQKTGSAYVICESLKSGLYRVSTKKGFPQTWIVEGLNIRLVK